MQMATKSQPDPRCRVLIVEDEIAVAMHLEDLLFENGYDVAEIATNIEQALHYLDRCHPDAVLLDLDLRGQRATPIAVKLRRKGIPFVLETAHAPEALTGTPFQGAAVVQKPWKEKDVLCGLSSILQNCPAGKSEHSGNVFSFPKADRALSKASGAGPVERPDLLKADQAAGPARLLPVKHGRNSTPYSAISAGRSPALPGTCAEHMDVHAIHGEAAELRVQTRSRIVLKGRKATPGISGDRPDIGLKQV